VLLTAVDFHLFAAMWKHDRGDGVAQQLVPALFASWQVAPLCDALCRPFSLSSPVQLSFTKNGMTVNGVRALVAALSPGVARITRVCKS